VDAPTVALVAHSDSGRHDTGWEHPEHVGRIRAVLRAVGRDAALFTALQHHEARHATPDDLALCHDPAYVARVRAAAERAAETRALARLDADTVVSEGSWDAATAGAGAARDATDLVLDGVARRAFAAVRPPGHHALRDSGMGFCLFGNVAVAAHHARARRGLDRVLVVDWDVHHGNGTQALVERTPSIRFVSMHQWPWYPGTGAAADRGPHGSVWNVPMEAGLAPARYVDAWERAIDAATAGWTPELIILSAGFDCLAGDPLGGFTLEMEHVDAMTRALVARAEAWCGGRLVSALEGGYAPDRVGEACAVHLRALA
jgi:acetoin utilization deacetylase AcuC-like enzyme